mmetsp:Transcript_69970/g.130813  ORF Transcript_69970/g.130813 Transcript_69970/m.130813 type:complete len:320 (+) Transcript_69970:74-1033(+)
MVSISKPNARAPCQARNRGPSQLKGQEWRRRCPLRATLVLAMTGFLVGWRPFTCFHTHSPTSSGAHESRALPRRAVLLGLPVAAVAAASDPVLASFSDDFVQEARKNAAERKKDKSFWNPDAWKEVSPNYDYSNLQDFLPTMYVVRKAYLAKKAQLEDESVNFTDPLAFELLRETNRIDPIVELRRAAVRVRYWLGDNAKGQEDDVKTAYDRLCRVVNDEDAQLLTLARLPTLVDPSAVKLVKKNVKEIVVALDNYLELVSDEDRFAAKAIADTKKVRVVRLPLKGEYKERKRKTNKKSSLTPAQPAEEASSQALPSTV